MAWPEANRGEYLGTEPAPQNTRGAGPNAFLPLPVFRLPAVSPIRIQISRVQALMAAITDTQIAIRMLTENPRRVKVLDVTGRCIEKIDAALAIALIQSGQCIPIDGSEVRVRSIQLVPMPSPVVADLRVFERNESFWADRSVIRHFGQPRKSRGRVVDFDDEVAA